MASDALDTGAEKTIAVGNTAGWVDGKIYQYDNGSGEYKSKSYSDEPVMGKWDGYFLMIGDDISGSATLKISPVETQDPVTTFSTPLLALDWQMNITASTSATAVWRAVVGGKVSTDQRILGDVSGNGTVSAYDAALILQKIAAGNK